jgi:hypothetical protein
MHERGTDGRERHQEHVRERRVGRRGSARAGIRSHGRRRAVPWGYVGRPGRPKICGHPHGVDPRGVRVATRRPWRPLYTPPAVLTKATETVCGCALESVPRFKPPDRVHMSPMASAASTVLVEPTARHLSNSFTESTGEGAGCLRWVSGGVPRGGGGAGGEPPVDGGRNYGGAGTAPAGVARRRGVGLPRPPSLAVLDPADPAEPGYGVGRVAVRTTRDTASWSRFICSALA